MQLYQFNNEVKVGKTDASLLEDVVSNSGRIQFELMSIIMKAGQFFSIGPVDDVPFNLMQVVWVISPHAKWVRSSRKESAGYFRAAIVKMSTKEPVGDMLPDDVNACATPGEMCTVDMLKLAPWAMTRKTLRKWEVGPVRFPGFKHLHKSASIDQLASDIDLGYCAGAIALAPGTS